VSTLSAAKGRPSCDASGADRAGRGVRDDNGSAGGIRHDGAMEDSQVSGPYESDAIDGAAVLDAGGVSVGRLIGSFPFCPEARGFPAG
jgi:hypothetical protein